MAKGILFLVGCATAIGSLFLSCETPVGFPYSPAEFVLPPPLYDFIDASTMKSFVGTRNVKIAFNSSSDVCIYYVDFNDSVPVVHRLKLPAGAGALSPNSPIISPDGQWVTYFMTGGPATNQVYVQKLDTTSDPVRVDNSFGTNPHWWVDPTDSSVYIIYSNDFWVDQGSLTSLTTFSTFKQKVTLSGTVPALVGSPLPIANKPFNGGLSSDGKYLCTGYADAAFFDVDSQTVIPVNAGLQICNPSITPAPDTDDQMMFLCINGVQNMNGSDSLGLVGEHEYIFVVDKDNFLRWQLKKPDGYEEWQSPKWSNNGDFAIALAGKSSLDLKYDCYVIQLSTHTIQNVLKPDSRDRLDNTSKPYVWIGK